MSPNHNINTNVKLLFITGCYRSGTTLVEKLLHNHPNIVVASQPFPILYFLAKQHFLDSLQLDRRYPLDHLFLEDAYTPEDFCKFLETHQLNEESLSSFFDTMDNYTEGLWTPEMTRFREKIKPGTFWQVYCQLNACVASMFPKSEAVYFGGKEVLCEEYIPHLLKKGSHVIQIIRDPRAMICSLNFRRRDNLTGLNRPVLYSLRAWRKSVAYALAYQNHPKFTYLRYEDLVINPTSTLARLTEVLNLSPYKSNIFEDGILDQHGKPWSGNSSFVEKKGITKTSINTFEDRLPKKVKAYIETLTLPEMKAIGYTPSTISSFNESALFNYTDPFEKIHPNFPADYSNDAKRLNDEINRYKLLAKGNASQNKLIDNFFIHPIAYKHLQKAL